MGIDQVLVIPTMLVNAFPSVRNAEGADGLRGRTTMGA